MALQDDEYLKEIVERKAKKNYHNNWLLPENQLKVKPGDNSKYLNVSMQLMSLPNIDLNDAEAVTERIQLYFKIHSDNDMKPTVAGMGLALNGMDRRRLWEIKTDTLPSGMKEARFPGDVRDVIKKAYKLMENLWENYMQNGKINPVSGIFLGKNNFGYQDKTEYVLTPNQRNENDYDADEIRARYLTDSDE